MPEAPKRKAHVISSFTDAGTGESFTAGATPLIDAGAFANYEAGGLVRAATVIKAAAKPKAKPKAKAASKPAAPASAPAQPATGAEKATD